MTEHRKPAAFKLESDSEPAPEAARTKRAPRAVASPQIAFEELPEQAIVAPPMENAGRRRRWHWSAVLLGAVSALISLAAGLYVTRLIEDAWTRSPVIGWIALGLALIAAFAALVIILREAWGLLRLRQLGDLQAEAARALNMNDEAAGKNAVSRLMALYSERADAAWGVRTMKEHEADILDARDRVKLAERALVAPRDGEAHRVIARSARRIAMLTAITPAAALDMLFVAAQSLRMIREIAALYGGRPTTLATLRLGRMVLGHLAITGGVALSDSILQHTLGKGLIGRLSARFGEGTVNGILTARIGLAARDVCRPIPQEPAAKETLASLVKELFSFGEENVDAKN